MPSLRVKRKWNWRQDEIPGPFFWSWVRLEGACWEWTGRVDSQGYGVSTIPGAGGHAHRVAWRFSNGSIPKGMCVCHKCDNRRCVKPEHLFLGTRADNHHDAVKKGRNARGERHRSAKLTEAQVIEARQLRASGVGVLELARRFGVSKMTMSPLLTGRTWSHVGGPRTPASKKYSRKDRLDALDV